VKAGALPFYPGVPLYIENIFLEKKFRSPHRSSSQCNLAMENLKKIMFFSDSGPKKLINDFLNIHISAKLQIHV
jgi:hypothetical protein